MSLPSLDSRVFKDVTEDRAGEISAETVFEYHEESHSVIWAHYAGGTIHRGYLVGTRAAASLAFRYVHVTVTGETASGRCMSELVELSDGRLRLHETWHWESKAGEGTSVLEDVLGTR